MRQYPLLCIPSLHCPLHAAMTAQCRSGLLRETNATTSYLYPFTPPCPTTPRPASTVYVPQRTSTCPEGAPARAGPGTWAGLRS